RLDPRILTLVPEPARPDRDIALGGQPSRAVPRSARRVLFLHVARGGRSTDRAYRVVGGPAGIAGDAALVAHPAHIQSHVAEDDRAGLQFPHQFPRVRPVVVVMLVDGALLARSAIVTVAAVRAVVPDFEDRAVIGQQLRQLLAIDFDVLRRAV